MACSRASAPTKDRSTRLPRIVIAIGCEPPAYSNTTSKPCSLLEVITRPWRSLNSSSGINFGSACALSASHRLETAIKNWTLSASRRAAISDGDCAAAAHATSPTANAKPDANKLFICDLQVRLAPCPQQRQNQRYTKDNELVDEARIVDLRKDHGGQERQEHKTVLPTPAMANRSGTVAAYHDIRGYEPPVADRVGATTRTLVHSLPHLFDELACARI